MNLCRKTQWEVPKWDTSPSSEDDHPSNITGLEGTSVTLHGYSSTAEVRFLIECCAHLYPFQVSFIEFSIKQLDYELEISIHRNRERII